LLTVLVSYIYAEDPSLIGGLRSRFPEVNFVGIGREAPFPSIVHEAKVLLYGGLTKPVLSALLNQAPKIEWIHTGTAGFDWLMVPEVEARSIQISRTLHAMDTPIAEFVLATMLAHFKNLARLLDAQQRRAWEPPMHGELFGKTLGIVGAGAIGTRIAGYAQAFGMRVLGIKRNPVSQPGFDAILPPSALHKVLEESDVVVLACPLTPETRYMMSYTEFQQMKPNSYLINIARGALIIEADLIRALNEGLIAGACLDVFELEPLPAESPLWTIPNLFVSPHCSYRSPQVRARVIDEFSENLTRYLSGEPVKNTMRHTALGY
jgi:phosphoglycerate dehydrogenase-like enzyme